MEIPVGQKRVTKPYRPYVWEAMLLTTEWTIQYRELGCRGVLTLEFLDDHVNCTRVNQ